MTYLELVNAVLRRLRVTVVSTVNENSYSSMIGDLVNDSKSTVESAWDWSALRTTLSVATGSDIFNYALTGSQNSIKLLDVINDTSNVFMTYRPSTWMNNVFLNSEPATGSPLYYSFNGVNDNGDTLVDLYPIPDGVYDLRFNSILRTPDLVEDTDVLIVPSRPVIHDALAVAARERGETGGTSTAEYFSMANNYLSDAIALDANRHPEELIFRVI
tara:strand:+ start:424 stop:1071 length:648 start_codon:yes stop_codon:yes gene_type:complete